MPTLQEILRDPNYVNANPATKKAIFDRWAPSDQNYTGANPATQAAIRQRFGVGMVEAPAEEPAKPEESGFLRQAADVPLSATRGVLTGVRMIADAFGAGSKASEAIKGADQYLAGLMSAQARNDEQEIARIMKEAEDKGALEQVKAGLKAFTVAPVDLISQGFGTAGPALLGLLGGKVLGAGMLGTRLIGAGIGAGMGAGSAKGGIYEATKEELTKAGLPEDQAEKRAEEAQAYGGKNLDQILLSTGLGAFASSTGLESATRRILLRSGIKEAAKQEAADVAKRGIVQTGKKITKGAAAEGVPEFIQAGQEQVAQNIALQREGFDVPTFRGAVGAGTLEALAGAGLGAGFGALESTQGGLREKARRDAADILEQERIAAGEEMPRTETAQAPAEVSDIEELERQFGMAPPPAEVEAEAAEPAAIEAEAQAVAEPTVETVADREAQDAEAAAARANEEALAEIDRPRSIAEEMEGVPAPRLAEVESEVERLTKDQEAAAAERTKLEKRTAGTSLMQVLKGTLNDGELSELGGRARKVGKNPFLNLKASKGQTGSSMEDMVDSGRLDIFLPENMRPDHPDYVNSESAEYIRDKLRNNQFYTYETELAIERVNQDIEAIERQIQDLLSDDEINKEIQDAANEQRELDEAAAEPTPAEEAGVAAEREPEAAEGKPAEGELTLEAPTIEDVTGQEERKRTAAELDEREQIRKESEAGAGQFELTREEGRQDTTGDIFAEPETVAVSTEQERKEALDKLGDALSKEVPPFKAVSANKTRLLKPALLNAAQKKEVLQLANDALDLGLPPAVLGNVTAAGATRMDATAVMSQSGWLMLAKDWNGETRASKLQILIHEFAHAVDTSLGTPSNGAKWDKAHAELKNWYDSSKKFGHMMSYPFAPQYKGEVRPKQESFAQAFSYYFTAPEDLQTNAPEAYSQIQSIIERIQNESQAARAAGTTKTGTAGIKIQPARGGKAAEVQPSAGEERVGISRAARLEDRGAGEVKQPSLAYHAGDLKYGKDTVLGRMMGGRSTGHFGTGVYFVGDESKIGRAREGRPVQAVDFSKYNLFRPLSENQAGKLHDAMRKINSLASVRIDDREEFKEEIKNAASSLADATGKDLREVLAALRPVLEPTRELAEKHAFESKYIPTLATQVMQGLGYEGIDVRGLGRYDGTEYGSVIYGREVEPEAKGEDQIKMQQEGNVIPLSADERAYFDSIFQSPADLEELRELVPSAKLTDAGLSVSPDDLSGLDDYVADTWAASKKGYGGEGAASIPKSFATAGARFMQKAKRSSSAAAEVNAMERADQTNTPAFKRWFGDSKIVDENGDPLVVYHGSPVRDFNIFDVSKINANDPDGPFNGFFFSSSEKDADSAGRFPWGRPNAEDAQTRAFYLSIKNPATRKQAKAVAREIEDALYDSNQFQEKYPGARSLQDATRQELQKRGYDGIIFEPYVVPSREAFERDGRVKLGKDASELVLNADGYVELYERGELVTDYGSFDEAMNSLKHGTFIAFRPEQIKSATGNIGTFDPEAQEINAMETAPKGRQNILGETVLGTWTEPTDTKMAGELGKDDIIYWLQDKMVDTKRVVQAITAKAGKIATQWNPYLQEELYHGRTAKETKDFLKDELRPLMQEMQKDGVTIGELEQYLHNRHAEAYNAQVAKVNPNDPEMQDGGSGITNEDARNYLDSLPEDKRKVYEKLAKRVDSITKGTRSLLVKSGLESKDTIGAWEAAFPDYVPLHREDVDFQYTTSSTGTGQGFDVRGPFSRRAMGSKRKVVDILANIAMQRERAIVKSNKNRVAQAVYGLAVQNPNPDFWLAVNPAAEKVPESAIEEMRALGIDEDAVKFLMKEPRQRAVDPKKNEVIARINATLRNNDSVLSMRLNGENRYVFFNPNNERSARAAQALKNLDADQLSQVMGMLSKVTRWFASVNTQYNPIFGAYNFLRDIQGAALQLSDTPLAGKQKEVTKNVLPALRAIYTSMRKERKGEKVDTEMAKLWDDFQKAGGQTGFRDMFSRSQERAEALQKEFAQMSDGRLKSAGRATLEWLSDYNDTMENAVRLAAYKVALDEGKNKDEAASIAKNLTVNFNKKGQVATQAGALYAFFNAAVQGTTRLVQTLRGPAGRKIVAGGLLLGTMQALLLAAAGFDEEEPPEFVRERNIVIPIGGDKYIMFPMPLGYHVIPGFSRIVTEWAMSGFKDTPDRVASLTGMFLEAFNPIGNAGWSVQSIAPTFADPLVALAENRDWTGKPIARKDFSSLDPTPGYTRAKDTASWISTQISKFLNYASGGTKYQPGIISWTPDQIDYLIGQATGGIGRELLKAEQTITKTATGEELPPYKIPVVGRFYGETKSSAAESSRFYKNMEQINKLENEIKGRRENREPLGDFLKENPEARLAGRAREIYSDVKKLRERREKLVERDAPRESVKAVETQITNKMRLLNEQVEKLKK